MKDFAAIDFETAYGRRCSVCSVGVVVVRGGEIVDKFYSLIQPTSNYYTYWTTYIPGSMGTNRAADTGTSSCRS